MFILLPPSEGKTRPPTGATVNLATLSTPGLSVPRQAVLEALIAVSSKDDAASVLGVGPSLTHEVARNRDLTSEPVAPAGSVYSGVLYDALGLNTMSPAARQRVDKSVRIFSALWGVVRPSDPIPAYRLSMKTNLPGIGDLTRYWRPHLTAQLAKQLTGQLIVDCRSTPYLAAWRPSTAKAELSVHIRPLSEIDGVRKIISHNAKKTRGEFSRHLLTLPGPLPETPQQLLAAAKDFGPAELMAPTQAGKPWQLHLITSRS